MRKLEELSSQISSLEAELDELMTPFRRQWAVLRAEAEERKVPLRDLDTLVGSKVFPAEVLRRLLVMLQEIEALRREIERQ